MPSFSTHCYPIFGVILSKKCSQVGQEKKEDTGRAGGSSRVATASLSSSQNHTPQTTPPPLVQSVSQSEQSEPLARGPNECQIVDNEPLLLLPLVMPPMPQAATRDYATNVMGRDRRGRHSGRIPDPWLQGSKGCIP